MNKGGIHISGLFDSNNMTIHKTSKMIFVFIVAFITSICFLLIPFQSESKSLKPKTSSGTIIKSLSIQEQDKAISDFGQMIYGKSGLGADLICYKISPTQNPRTKILMNFEIHGFEDKMPKDGQVLVNIANHIVKYFKSHRNLLENSELYIIPSSNPDGLSHGYTEDGIGRCQASLGIDINRDFDYFFRPSTDSRYHTLSKPFSAPETRGLRDIIHSIKPNIVIDCHGWENNLIGNKNIADCFNKSLQINHQQDFSSNNYGFLSAWAGTQGAKSMLLELPPAAYYSSTDYANKTVRGIQNLAAYLKK